jgi:hypothetical protein
MQERSGVDSCLHLEEILPTRKLRCGSIRKGRSGHAHRDNNAGGERTTSLEEPHGSASISVLDPKINGTKGRKKENVGAKS